MKAFRFLLIPALSLLLNCSALAGSEVKPETLPPGQNLYIIEREIPDLGQWRTIEE